MALYKVGPHSIRNKDQMTDFEARLFNQTQGIDRKTIDIVKPSNVRKKSMNKQGSKNSMLFTLGPMHTISHESSANLSKKHRKRRRNS